jgi:purine-binding chemotaxis protein CheW
MAPADANPADIRMLASDALELACFGVNGQLYALDVRQVREVARCPVLVALPQAPPLIEGVVELRGRVVPVVDLGRALRGVPVADAESRVALVEAEGLVFGLRVGREADVVRVEPSALEETPALASRAGYELVRAVVRRADGPPLLWLSLEHLLARIARHVREDA